MVPPSDSDVTFLSGYTSSWGTDDLLHLVQFSDFFHVDWGLVHDSLGP